MTKRRRRIVNPKVSAFRRGQEAEVAIAVQAMEKKAADLGISPDDAIGRRKLDVPAGMKKNYIQPAVHTGKKELEKARRRAERQR